MQERIQGWQAAGFPMSIVEGCRATYPNQCSAPRFRGWHTSTKVVLGEHRDMGLQLLLEVTIEVRSPEERSDARAHLPQETEHLSPPRTEL